MDSFFCFVDGAKDIEARGKDERAHKHLSEMAINPEDVLVKKLAEDDFQIHIQLLVNKSDVGRVIGKGGRIANAIRTIIYAGASKEGKKVHLDIDSY